MPDKTFEEKVEFIRATRLQNYKESLRLEGITVTDIDLNQTKEEIIKKYLKKG